MSEPTSDLANIGLLADLDHATRTDLARACSWRTCEPGQHVIDHLDRSQDVFFIVAGRVRVMVHSPNGREVVFRELIAGQQFGEFSAIDEEPRSATVVATERCTLARLPAAAFRRLIEDNPGVKDRLLRELLGLARALSHRVFEFSTIAVHNRVQAEILRMARDSGVTNNEALIRDPPNHETVAARVSTHREAVSREISRLRQAGLIERRGRSWKVTDVDQLAALVNDAVGLPLQQTHRA